MIAPLETLSLNMTRPTPAPATDSAGSEAFQDAMDKAGEAESPRHSESKDSPSARDTEGSHKREHKKSDQPDSDSADQAQSAVAEAPPGHAEKAGQNDSKENKSDNREAKSSQPVAARSKAGHAAKTAGPGHPAKAGIQSAQVKNPKNGATPKASPHSDEALTSIVGKNDAAQHETLNAASQQTVPPTAVAAKGGTTDAQENTARSTNVHSRDSATKDAALLAEKKQVSKKSTAQTPDGRPASPAGLQDVGAKVAAQNGSIKEQRLLRSEHSHAAAILALRSKQDHTTETAATNAQSGKAPTHPISPGMLHHDKAAGKTHPTDATKAAGGGTAPPSSTTSGTPDASQMLGASSLAASGNPNIGQPSTSTALPTPFHPLVDAIRAQIATQSQGPSHNGHSGTDLMLHPAELGRIHFAMTGTGHQLTITIGAENHDTLALLQRHVADLRAELSQEGLGQTAFSFTNLGQGASGGSSNPMPTPLLDVADDKPESDPAAFSSSPTPTRRLNDGTLDLRL